jgi:hypothetical protein
MIGGARREIAAGVLGTTTSVAVTGTAAPHYRRRDRRCHRHRGRHSRHHHRRRHNHAGNQPSSTNQFRRTLIPHELPRT